MTRRPRLTMRLHPRGSDLSVDAPGRQPLCRHPQFSVRPQGARLRRGLPLSVASDQFIHRSCPGLAPDPGLGPGPVPGARVDPSGPASRAVAALHDRASPATSGEHLNPVTRILCDPRHSANRASRLPTRTGLPNLAAACKPGEPSLPTSARPGKPSRTNLAAGPVRSPPSPVARALRLPRGLWVPG